MHNFNRDPNTLTHLVNENESENEISQYYNLISIINTILKYYFYGYLEEDRTIGTWQIS